MPLTFITGAARCGKSRFAEQLALEAELPVTYIATARRFPDDPQWEARLARHAARRPCSWSLIETAVPAARALPEIVIGMDASSVALVDSLGTWLADRMSERVACLGEKALADTRLLEAECDVLSDALSASPARVIVVSEEVGWGIVPAYESARVFGDLLGRMNQRLACAADAAFLVVSAFAIRLDVVGERVMPRV